MERWGFVTILGVYMELRVCYICKQEKDLNLFASDKQKASGKASACKVCKNLRRREVRKHKMLHDEEFRKKRLEVRKRQTQNYKNNKGFIPYSLPRIHTYILYLDIPKTKIDILREKQKEFRTMFNKLINTKQMHIDDVISKYKNEIEYYKNIELYK